MNAVVVNFANWELPAGATDTFDINQTHAGKLTLAAVAQDTLNEKQNGTGPIMDRPGNWR